MATGQVGRLRGAERESRCRAVLGRWAVSDLSKAAFCRTEGITTVTLLRWTKEFAPAAGPERPGRFVEVRLEPSSTPARGFELELGASRRLRIPPGFDAGDLRRLLATLEEGPC